MSGMLGVDRIERLLSLHRKMPCNDDTIEISHRDGRPHLVPTYCTSSARMNAPHVIAEAGFPQTELAFPDLKAYAAHKFLGYTKLAENGRGDLETQTKEASKTGVSSAGAGVPDLRVHAWFKVLKALKCEMLQVGSSDDPSTSVGLNIIARNLRQLADEAAAPDPPICM
ncbi:hypothetical protein A0H81_12118 [Grifola frondosa]|uniref:Uncharacterized protein n=1 Tax=Grifola frondosa TaxID=5627 RepID=A0A1C7LU54_GRIFR|nr:hypothetical protein A0H81_12118 [Grifola frondosa]